MDTRLDEDWLRKRGTEFAAQIRSELNERGYTDVHQEDIRMFIFERIKQIVDVDNRKSLTEHERQLLRQYLRDDVAQMGNADKELNWRFKNPENIDDVMTDHFNVEFNNANFALKCMLCAMPQQYARLTPVQKKRGRLTLLFSALYLLCLPAVVVITFWLVIFLHLSAQIFSPLVTLAAISWGLLAATWIHFYYGFRIRSQRIAEQKILEARKFSAS